MVEAVTVAVQCVRQWAAEADVRAVREAAWADDEDERGKVIVI